MDVIMRSRSTIQEYHWPMIMNRKFKQRWKSIPPISTKGTITSHLNSMNKKRQHMMLEIYVLACDRHINVVVLNQLMGSQPFPLKNWIYMYVWLLKIELIQKMWLKSDLTFTNQWKYILCKCSQGQVKYIPGGGV